MAHLSCVEHGRRSLVVENILPGRKKSDLFRVLHRGEPIECSGQLRHGPVVIAPITVALGLINLHKRNHAMNLTDGSNSDKPVSVKERKPKARNTRKTRRA